nr:reverse transcriptase domain-containing protein [Tanacetum cinerariifolium]
MSDVSSAVTYTFVHTNSEPWRYYGEDSAETGPLRVIVYGYDGLPIQPIASPSPDYVPGPEHPPFADYVPCLEHLPSPIEIPYIPESEYPEYLESSVDDVPFEDQPLSADASPITTSSDYVADYDPEEDPEEDPEDDESDYPADGGDGDDEHSDADDEDPEEEPFKEDDEEEEEHPTLADSSAIPIVDLVLPAGDTKALKADEPTHAPGSPIIIPFSQTHLHRARKTVKPEPPMSASMKACIARHVTLPSPPLLIPSLPLPFPSPLTTCPTDTGAPLGYRAARIRMRALLLSTSRRTDIPEADIPPRKRACLTTSAPGFKNRESSAADAARQPGPKEFDLRRSRVKKAGYGITDMWDEIVNKLMEIAPTTLKGLNERVTELDTTVRQRTDKFDIRFKEAQDDRALLIAQVNTLFRDRLDHHPTAMLMDREGMYAREEWAFSIDRSVAAALAKHDADKSRKGDNSNDSGTGRRRQMTTPREFSYIDFLKCHSMSFQGTEGIVKFTSCTLQGSALTWWNSHMRSVRQDVAYAIPWATLKRMITDKYCPRGHYKSDCPKLKNGNQGNRVRNGNDMARAYVVGTVRTNPNSNVVTGTFLLNNRYALVLFDTGADRSFISTVFSSLIDIIPTTLDHGYDVELCTGSKLTFREVLVDQNTMGFSRTIATYFFKCSILVRELFST